MDSTLPTVPTVAMRFYNYVMKLYTVTNLINTQLDFYADNLLILDFFHRHQLEPSRALELMVIVTLAECLQNYVWLHVTNTKSKEFIDFKDFKKLHKKNAPTISVYTYLDHLILHDRLDFTTPSSTLTAYILAHRSNYPDTYAKIAHIDVLTQFYQDDSIKRQVFSILNRRDMSEDQPTIQHCIYEFMKETTQIEATIPETMTCCKPVCDSLHARLKFHRRQKTDEYFILHFLTQAIIQTVNRKLNGQKDEVLGDTVDYANLHYLYIKEKQWYFFTIEQYTMKLAEDIYWPPICQQIQDSFESRYPAHKQKIRDSLIYCSSVLSLEMLTLQTLPFIFAIMGKHQHVWLG